MDDHLTKINELESFNVELVSIHYLKPHEEIDNNRLTEIKESIIKEGLKFPIVVDIESKIILDGHHRLAVFKELEIDKIPVYYVNYSDKKIIIDTWNEIRVTKDDIIKMVNSGKLFPNKTTKHMIFSNNGYRHISSITPRINVNISEILNTIKKQ
ncbi:MAG: ParB N-terminal domain-containing protein [Candidatus Aenigmarchaeota archaeon]|nr:ParB N-terminal domain-containing protein [Candidatus Aenigmarchaeota archaeon]